MRVRFAPDLRIALSPELDVQLSCGRGAQRRTAVLRNPAFVRWLVAAGTAEVDAIEHARAVLGRDPASATALVDELVGRGVLVAVDDPRRVRDWPPVAATLHDATIDLVFESTAESAANHAALISRFQDQLDTGGDEPAPPRYRVHHGPRTACRDSADPVLGLVVDAFGVVEEFEFPPWGPHFVRTSPSLGARHAVDGYLIDAGGCHAVDVRGPELVRLGDGDHRAALRAACPGLAPADTYVVLAIHWPRLMWKYRHGRYYAMALQDAGHLWASLELAAHVRGLAATACFELDEVAVAALLGVDPLVDGPICVVGLDR